MHEGFGGAPIGRGRLPKAPRSAARQRSLTAPSVASSCAAIASPTSDRSVTAPRVASTCATPPTELRLFSAVPCSGFRPDRPVRARDCWRLPRRAKVRFDGGLYLSLRERQSTLHRVRPRHLLLLPACVQVRRAPSSPLHRLDQPSPHAPRPPSSGCEIRRHLHGATLASRSSASLSSCSARPSRYRPISVVTGARVPPRRTLGIGISCRGPRPGKPILESACFGQARRRGRGS